MVISLIAAMDEDRVIGSADRGLPWDLPRDRAHFRASTAGKWVLVGRRTYTEMEGWFGDRRPVVLTSETGFRPFEAGHRVVHSVVAALELARQNGAPELMVLGGGGVFAATLSWADRILLTRIALRATVVEPVRFPDFERSGTWRCQHAEVWPAEDGTPAARYEIHVRKSKASLA